MVLYVRNRRGVAAMVARVGYAGFMPRKPVKPARTPNADDRLVLLHGKDGFLRSEHTSALRETLCEALGDVDVLHFDGATAVVADVLDECRSFGLMQQHKLVVVDEADQFVKEDARPLIERYADAPADGATLVLRAGKWHKGKLDKFIEAHGIVIKCDAPTAAQSIAWTIKRCSKRHAATIDHDAAVMLVDRVGANLGKIDSELGKLASAAGRSPCGDPVPIGTALVREFVGLSREEEVWGIQAELLLGDAERSLKHLREMLDVSRHPPELVNWACVDLARKLSAATHAGHAGEDLSAVEKKLRLWGASRDPIMRLARTMKPDSARELLDVCVRADVAQKTSLGRSDRQLERVVLAFANAVR